MSNLVTIVTSRTATTTSTTSTTFYTFIWAVTSQVPSFTTVVTRWFTSRLRTVTSYMTNSITSKILNLLLDMVIVIIFSCIFNKNNETMYPNETNSNFNHRSKTCYLNNFYFVKIYFRWLLLNTYLFS